MSKQEKNTKGITLVALVITIIVLLILAGISIQTLTQTGLFNNAKQATALTKEAQKNEEEIINTYADAINNYSSGVEIKQDEWNSTQKVNSPQLMEGMKGVYWDDSGTEIEVTESNKNNWYNYDQQKWANAKTEDGSYWVWIPRYAYKIESGCYTNTRK